MTAQELTNLGVCGAGNAMGFNVDNGCPEDFKKDYTTWFLDTSLEIPSTQEINETYIKSLQSSGKLIIVPRMSNLTDIGSDDTTETQEDDTIVTTTEGKYRFEMTYNHSMYFNKALGSIEGFGNYRMVRIDIKGNMLLTEGASGGVRGFATNEIKRGKQQVAKSAASAKRMLRVQLANRFETDDNYVLWKRENLGFDPRNIAPVTQIFLSLTAVPSDTDTTISVKAVVDRGRKTALSGALFGQWLNKVNGSTSNPTAGDDSTTAGTYPLTVAALSTNDTGTISLYDNSGNSSVVDIAGFGLVKSNTLAYTVTA
ncbi:hypothetical protein [uncultured Winogradskyella sp.]|uniref:hypothetical protein n=1 Tax=uncultured Winogradskyella sp. TaxID=395353 RepID=UPI00262F42E0|nr:hypothetical protein [uncultured Winogradskyella sp.]